MPISFVSRDRHVAMFDHAYWLVRSFYLVNFFYAFSVMRDLHGVGASSQVPDPLWPVFWVRWFDLASAANFIGISLLLSSVLNILMYHSRTPRVLIFIFFIQAAALFNSFGAMNHSHHVWVWLTFCFMFFPTEKIEVIRKSFRSRHWFLTCFFLTQLVVALFYTLSGLFKVYFGFFVKPDSVSSFSGDALEVLAVGRWTETDSHPLLQGIFANLFENHSWVGRLIYLLIMYIELFAVMAMFRPAIQQVFGIGLMFFHLSVWMLLGISFPFQPVTMALLYVWSPFVPAGRVAFARYLAQLPVVGDLLYPIFKAVLRK